ncbi:hypothetical protein ACLSU7_11030 [Bdellovibrio sp. HCB185ZH]|uniref:hypothetical protein n=1 Tax=Bdellovibrio sp. HCB185ZH TaxID=3394235 RepID=UPI0039A4B8C1
METDNEFKLIIQGNAAFYLLPKGSNAADVRTQLVSLHKSKTSVNAVVNAFSRQIITLETSFK